MLHYDLGKYFMSQPLISIITINRNNADGLRKTMQSVLSQTFDNYEYVIIDGASTDNSVEVIKSFVEDSKYADKIVENILNAPLRTKSKVAAVFRIREDTATAIVQIKKIHPPAHIIVISNDYEDYNELNKTLNNASVFRGYYSSKKQSTQMKDYKTGKKSN